VSNAFIKWKADGKHYKKHSKCLKEGIVALDLLRTGQYLHKNHKNIARLPECQDNHIGINGIYTLNTLSNLRKNSDNFS
jgi:hypothetical protein